MRNFGFVVDVSELGMSGLVLLSAITHDFFIFDPARNHLSGRRTRRIIRLGDNVVVHVCKVDSFKKQVHFAPARSCAEMSAGPQQKHANPRGRQSSRPPAKPEAPSLPEHRRGEATKTLRR